jgi:hypothetical protein
VNVYVGATTIVVGRPSAPIAGHVTACGCHPGGIVPPWITALAKAGAWPIGTALVER